LLARAASGVTGIFVVPKKMMEAEKILDPAIWRAIFAVWQTL
jgi:hypothetical protein